MIEKISLDFIDCPNYFCCKNPDGNCWIECLNGSPLNGWVNNTGYRRYGLGGKQYQAHRLFMLSFVYTPRIDRVQVDHIDGDKLNNNLNNLRWLTPAENSHNSQKSKGYCWDKYPEKWKACIRFEGKPIHLGLFDDEEDARECYLEASAKYFPAVLLAANKYLDPGIEYVPSGLKIFR